MQFIVWKRLRKSVNTKLRLLQRSLVNQLSHYRCQFLLHMHDVLDVPVQISGSCDRLSAGSQSVIYIERRWYVFSQYFGSFLNTAKCFPASILQYIKNSRCRWSHGGIYQAFFWDVTQCHLADICMRISARNLLLVFIFYALKKEAAYSSETLKFIYQITWCYNPEYYTDICHRLLQPNCGKAPIFSSQYVAVCQWWQQTEIQRNI